MAVASQQLFRKHLLYHLRPSLPPNRQGTGQMVFGLGHALLPARKPELLQGTKNLCSRPDTMIPFELLSTLADH